MSKETTILNQLEEQHLTAIKDTPRLAEKTKKKYGALKTALKRNDMRPPVYQDGMYRCDVCGHCVIVYARFCDACGGAIFWRD